MLGRAFARRPGLAIARVSTVAVVVAAAASVFAIANATVFRRLPFPSAERLVRIGAVTSGQDARTAGTLFPIAFARYRDLARSFEAIEGAWIEDRSVVGAAEPATLSGARVTAGYLPLLGAQLLHGRVFTEAEAAARAPVVVLGHDTWSAMFAGDPAAVGRSLAIDGEPFTVIGVLHAGFEPPFGRPAFYTPLDYRRHDRLRATVINAIGRIPPGLSIGQMSGELESALRVARQDVPDLLQDYRVAVIDLRDSLYGSRRPALIVLVVAVAALMLVAIANLANLTIADLLTRRAEFALRRALGGGRIVIALPELAHCATVGILGGAAGLGATALLMPPMLALDPAGALVSDLVEIDWRVALACVTLAIAMMGVTVAVPLARMSRADAGSVTISTGRRAAGSRASRRARAALVAAQAAITLVLLSSAALIITTLQNTAAIDPGFDPRNVVTLQLRLSERAFPDVQARARFVANLLQRLREVPGVVAAGTTLNPFRNGGGFTTNVHVEDRPAPDGSEHSMQYRRVSPGYFEALGVRLVKGRTFTADDDLEGQPVAIVSRSFAEKFWPGGDPLARRIRRGPAAAPFQAIVGVVDDVRDAGLQVAPGPTLYTPYFQGSSPAAPVALVVRTAGHPSGFVGAIKRAVWSIDSNQPLSNIVTLTDYLAAGLGPQRFRAILVTLCGCFGLLLATIGTYAVTARSVLERTREIGVRIAVGGDPASVRWTMAGTSLRAVFGGTLVGILGATAAHAGIARLLPELDGPAWRLRAGAAAVLLVIGGAAAAIASRQAVSIDPARALQAE